jgi:hypothetical protein
MKLRTIAAALVAALGLAAGSARADGTFRLVLPADPQAGQQTSAGTYSADDWLPVHRLGRGYYGFRGTWGYRPYAGYYGWRPNWFVGPAYPFYYSYFYSPYYYYPGFFSFGWPYYYGYPFGCFISGEGDSVPEATPLGRAAFADHDADTVPLRLDRPAAPPAPSAARPARTAFAQDR